MVSQFSGAVIKHQKQKQLGAESIYFMAALRLYSSPKEVRAGAQGRNLETGTDAETMDAAYWLLPLPYSAYFLIPPRTRSPRVVIVPSEPGPPTPITNGEITLQTYLQTNSTEAFSQ